MVRWRAGDCPVKRSCPLTPGIIAHTTAVYQCPNYIYEEKEHSNRHDRIAYRGNVIPICESCWIIRYASRHATHAQKMHGKDRKSVGKGKSVSVRLDLGGRRIIKTKKNVTNIIHEKKR